MAVKDVLRWGDPRLLGRAEPVRDFGPALKALLKDMFETMAAYRGAGLAAPQIGMGLRVVVFGFEKNPRYPQAEAVPTTILINPEIEIASGERESDWEGCLSIPGMRGWVPRHAHIRYRGWDEQGREYKREVRGFHARVVQHECDHLDGVLYPMRMPDLSKFGFEDVLFPKLGGQEG
jgi:peptide deformylase